MIDWLNPQHARHLSLVGECESLQISGLHLWCLDTLAITDEATLIQTIAHALGAYEPFPINWDALADILGDLPDARGYILYLGPSPLSLSSEELAIWEEIIEQTITYWRGHHRPFWAIWS